VFYSNRSANMRRFELRTWDRQTHGQTNKRAERNMASCPPDASDERTSGQRILTRGRISGTYFSLGKFNVTLDCISGQPVGQHVRKSRENAP